MNRNPHLEAAIAGLEAQRATLGDLVVDSALEALRHQMGEPDRTGTLEGERKLVTIMFADISGYTALSEKLDAERARDLLNACFEALVPIIERYGGTIDKFVGDEIVALFGAPVAHENDAERACGAALEMMREIQVFNRARDTGLDLHFGINTGRVVAGEVGTSERHAYSVIGHPVNLAARLEDASERSEIFVGAQTQRMAAAFYEFEELSLRVKGVSQVVTAFRLLRARATSGPTRGIAGRSSPIVGREPETSALRQILDGLASGRGAVVAVVGEAGVGKSRLLAEARKWAPQFRWHEGRSLSHTTGMSYWLARDLLRDILGFDGAASARIEAEELRMRLNEVIGERVSRTYPLLARFLELPLAREEEKEIGDLTAEALRRRTGEAIAAFLLASVVTRPTVVVCEDLHWGDSSSLQLLQGLLPLAKNAPLLWLFALRRDDEAVNDFLKRAAAQLGDRFCRLDLEPLSAGASERLLRNLLQAEEIPEAFAQLILRKTEGNAFFLEELLRSLIEDGSITFRDGAAVFSREIGQLNVPDSVQSVLAARMDRLPTEEKSLLQTASVLGRVFNDRLLAQIVAHDLAEEKLESSLGELVAREFLRRHGFVN